MKFRFGVAALLGATSLSTGGLAFAQDGEDAKAILDVIVVEGIRGSLERAQDIKRNAGAVIEAVTLEDLGQFTDENLADALQRVPGVQVQRNDNAASDGGDRITIRGLGPQFVQTTINGRLPLSAGSEGISNLREFNFDTVPPEILNGLVVYKTPEAHTVEAGIAGLVDIQTTKPLNRGIALDQNVWGVANARYLYDDQAKSWGPRFSGILGLKDPSDTFGMYIAFVDSNTDKFREEAFLRTLQANNIGLDADDNGVRDNTIDTVINDITVPNIYEWNPIEINEKRQALSGAAQFRKGNFEVIADFISTEYDTLQSRDVIQFQPLLRNNAFYEPESVLIEDGQLQFFDGEGNLRANLNNLAGEALRFNRREILFDNFTDNLIAGVNAAWDNDEWRIALDYSYSEVDFYQYLRMPVALQTRANAFQDAAGNPVLDTAIFDDRGDATLPAIYLDDGGASLLDPANFSNTGAFNRDLQNRSQKEAFALDFKRTFSNKLNVEFGVRYDETEIDVREAQLPFSIPMGVTGQDIANLAFSDETFTIFGDDLPAGAVNVFNFINGTAVAEAFYPELLTDTARGTPVFEMDSALDAGLFALASPDFTPGALNFYETFEDTLAFYGQVNFKGVDRFPGPRFDGNVGLRAVRTDVESLGYSSFRILQRGPDVDDIDGDMNTTEIKPVIVTDFIPNSAESSSWEYLPNLNLNFHINQKTKLRFAYARTMTRPSYRDQVPFNDVRFFVADGDVIATGGNADLSPYTADNIDITFERYTDNGGAFYASAFFKRVSDFVIRETVENAPVAVPFDPADIEAVGDAFQLGTFVPGAGFEAIATSATIPINIAEADVYGFELGMNMPFDFLPGQLSHTGLLANYTYVTSEFSQDVGDGGFGFPGSSENNWNTVAYYENGPLSSRISYTYRGDYLRNLSGVGDRRDNAFFTEPQEQLNANAAYNVNDNLTLSANVNNILGESRRDFRGVEGNFQAIVTRGTTYVFGARYKF